METRMNDAQEVKQLQPACVYQSEYLTIPEYGKLDVNGSKDEYILRETINALNKNNAKLKYSSDAAKQKSAIARDLVTFVRTLSPNLCLSILIEASRHSIFSHAPAHQIIVNAISRETLYRSPVIVGDHTFAKVKFLHQTSPVEVENFLKNPELILIWINLAAATETSRLLNHYYQSDSLYYLRMAEAAKQEIASGQPAKAVLCTALMNAERPTADDAEHIKRALEWLAENEPAASYERIIKSVQLYLNPEADTFNKAAGCFINANAIELNIVKLTAHDFRGARLKKANLDYLSFANIDLSGACLDGASLSGVDMNSTNLSDASLVHANLTFSNFINNNFNNTDFSSADFSYADLTSANLKNAKFDNAIFEGTEFIVSHKFYDSLALEAELDRLHGMLLMHRNETRLREAVIQQIILFTHKSEVDTATATTIVKTALSHDFSKQYNPVELLKTGANFVSSYAQAAYQNLFFTAELPRVPAIETNEERLLNQELAKLEALNAAALAAVTAAAIVRP